MGASQYPLAYLLTWTCYGTWLHGDERGSVDVDHNIPGTPFLPEDEVRFLTAYRSLKDDPYTLDEAARRVVHQTIVEHASIRGWNLLAVNVRTNHVHVVLVCGDTQARQAMTQLRSWATRRLREAGCLSPDRRAWTHHGSTRYLWNERSVINAVNYVNEQQGANLT